MIKKINAQLGFALDGSIDCKKRATMPSNIIELCYLSCDIDKILPTTFI